MVGFRLLGVLFVLCGGSQQGADGQRDALMLLIDVDDLRVDFLTLGQNVLRLADAAIRDLGDVDEAVNARDDLSESAEGHELDDLDLGNVADLELVVEQGPGVGRFGLVAEGDLALFGIESDDVDVDLVADLDGDGTSDLTAEFSFADGSTVSLLWFYSDGGLVYNAEFSLLPGNVPAGDAE